MMVRNRLKSEVRHQVPLLAFLIVLLSLANLDGLTARLSEYRFYRDIAGITPFSKVEVTRAVVVEDGIILSGWMRKDRCTFKTGSLVGYIYRKDKPRRRVLVNTSVEDARGVKGNRPPSKYLEEWGPWKLNWQGERPKSWNLYASHKDCPTPPETQTNEFATGSWANFERED